MDPRQQAKDVQVGLGAEPIDELIAELDATEDGWARGAALYGPGGLFDDQRVMYLSMIALEHREAVKEGEKVTDEAIKQRAHADKRYQKWLLRHTKQRYEWLKLDAHRDGIMLRANRGQALMRVAGRV